jgi:protein-S-isoprenylcysteine O-methyltransferase Ste14
MFAWSGGAVFVLSLLFSAYCYLFPFGQLMDDGPLVRPIVMDVALFTLFALHHSILARSSVKDRVRAVTAPELERSLYVWVSSILFILVCGFWQAVPGVLYRLSGPAAWTGYAIQSLGLLATIRSASRLDVLDLAGIRPLERSSRAGLPDHVPLETRGWYGFVRHPLYFGWALMVFGTPHMTMTRLVFAATSTIYLAVAIPFEERSLIQVFGGEYRTYQQRVRWRMIPGIY